MSGRRSDNFGQAARCREYQHLGVLRCANPAGDSGYCGIHDPGRRVWCAAVTAEGGRCRVFPRVGGVVCWAHEEQARRTVAALLAGPLEADWP